MSDFSRVLILAALGVSLLSTNTHAQDDKTKFFESKIRPVLIKECYGCHSATSGKIRGSLLVDSKQGLLEGGDSGPAIVPGDLDSSLLWNAINYEDFNMPPGKPLSRNEIANFKTWIESGAHDPRVTKISKINSTITKEDIEEGRKFWAYQPPRSHEIPKVKREKWANTTIDRFVLEKLEAKDLKPAKDADPSTVLRRLCFDLIGLPPTPEQISFFLKKWKTDPDSAVAHVVDNLLECPQFGERWGRHWLDVARYAESTGRELNATYPHAWRYRDYVIDSFNEDKPYDRFIQEQIAGDLLPVDDDEQWAENLIATGFLALGPKSLPEQNGRQFNLDLIDEQIDVTTRVVLGTSVACARCHDHKFDPIPQADYYAMAGIFQSTTTHYGTLDSQQNRRPSNLLILPTSDPNSFEKPMGRAELANLKKQLTEKRAQLRVLAQQRRQARQGNSTDQQFNIRDFARTSSEIGALEDRINSYDENGNPFTQAMGVQSADRPVDARLLIRGEFDKPAQLVKRGFVQVASEEPATIGRSSSGRLELAKWMTDPNNPLTARVMVNRIWQHLFGNGIVRSPDNFGATGMAPTHPELLDHLALEFIKNGWSTKKLIREITTSHVYRTSSEFDRKSFNADPDNELIWRIEPRRLEAEVIRDSILSVSGQLDSERPRASIVARAGHTIVRDGNLVQIASAMDARNAMQNMSSSNSNSMQARIRRGDIKRPEIYNVEDPDTFRSIYLPILRDNVPRAMDVFDFAESSMVISQRETSNTPSQGLYLLNNSFVIAQSGAMAKRLIKETNNAKEQVERAFLLAYGREATQNELEAVEKFYGTFESGGFTRRTEHQKKLTVICQAILASAEFRYVN